MNCVICLVGPTGTGKSSLSLEIGELIKEERIDISILNCDSRQVYKDFPIVTAQPTKGEMRQFPHLFYGFLESTAKISAGQWAEAAYNSCQELFKKNTLPIFVGGTGFYLRSLLDGITKIPEIPIELHKKYERILSSEGNEVLYMRLETLDPEYAAKIHRNDSHRTMRALEVLEFTAKTFTWWHRQTPPAPEFNVLRLGLGLPLDELTPILRLRIEKMLQEGAVEEVEKALLKCPDLSAPAWSGIGCTDIVSLIKGNISFEECINNWTQKTRDYAKRQWTWFKADKRIIWFRPEQKSSALDMVKQFILSIR